MHAVNRPLIVNGSRFQLSVTTLTCWRALHCPDVCYPIHMARSRRTFPADKSSLYVLVDIRLFSAVCGSFQGIRTSTAASKGRSAWRDRLTSGVNNDLLSTRPLARHFVSSLATSTCVHQNAVFWQCIAAVHCHWRKGLAVSTVFKLHATFVLTVQGSKLSLEVKSSIQICGSGLCWITIEVTSELLTLSLLNLPDKIGTIDCSCRQLLIMSEIRLKFQLIQQTPPAALSKSVLWQPMWHFPLLVFFVNISFILTSRRTKVIKYVLCWLQPTSAAHYMPGFSVPFHSLL